MKAGRIACRLVVLMMCLFPALTFSARAGEGEPLPRPGRTLAQALVFEDEADLARWQSLEAEPAARADFEREVLSERRALRLEGSVAVVVRGRTAPGRLRVEMATEGRLAGTVWFIDATGLGP
jgi:hypothetical protein